MKTQGYIAITSAIVISILVLTIVLALSFSGFYGRTNIGNSYYKQISRALAESCVDSARLKIAYNPLYSPTNEIVAIGSDSCIINSVQTVPTPTPPRIIIKTEATINGAVTNLEVALHPLDLSVISWDEIPTRP